MSRRTKITTKQLRGGRVKIRVVGKVRCERSQCELRKSVTMSAKEFKALEFVNGTVDLAALGYDNCDHVV